MGILCRDRGNRAGLIAISGLLVLTSCAAVFATKIADINSAPSKYDGRNVTIAGKVTSTHNLLVLKYYEVDDGSGQIPVVTQSELPKEGDKVRVKGRVNQAFVLGTAHLVVIVEEPPSR
jgi:hypothetical protein